MAYEIGKVTNNLVYKGGHPSLTSEKDCKLTVTSDGITISCGFTKQVMIPISQVTNTQLETQDQVEKRITATRLLTLGVFALAFKKKKKTTDKYLTIDYQDVNGIENTVLFSGKNVPKAHSMIYEALTTYKTTMNTERYEENDDTPTFEDIMDCADTETDNISVEQKNDADPYEEIKKVKELLDMGIITQEEFDEKKKQLLGL